jgi:hypothetical protein
MRKIKLLLGVVCMVAFTAPTYASISYTNETTFLAGIQAGYYLEDFNAYTYGSYNSPNPLSLSANGYGWTMSSPGGLYSSKSAMSTGNTNTAIIVNFSGNPVTAIGGIFGPSDADGNFVAGNLNLTLSDGTSLTNYPVNIGDFLGFTSTVPITSMTINAPDSDMFAQVDHFYVGTAVVPIPGAVWLLGSGLIGLVTVRRRFRK